MSEMANDRDEDADPDSTPLSDLAERVSHERMSPHEESDSIWEMLDRSEYPGDSDIWAKLTQRRDVVTPTVDGDLDPVSSGTRVIDENHGGVGGLSTIGQIIHGYITALIFLLGLLIVTAAATGIITNHLWVLSLPLFALGVILLVPVIAWELDVWDPREIG